MLACFTVILLCVVLVVSALDTGLDLSPTKYLVCTYADKEVPSCPLLHIATYFHASFRFPFTTYHPQPISAPSASNFELVGSPARPSSTEILVGVVGVEYRPFRGHGSRPPTPQAYSRRGTLLNPTVLFISCTVRTRLLLEDFRMAGPGGKRKNSKKKAKVTIPLVRIATISIAYGLKTCCFHGVSNSLPANIK